MTDNLLQYQDIDPAPSFSLSSTLHSNLPSSSVSALANSAAHSSRNIFASKNNIPDEQSQFAMEFSPRSDIISKSNTQSASHSSRVSSKFPLLSPFRPVSSLVSLPPHSFSETLNDDISSKKRLMVVMPDELRARSNISKISASAIIRPVHINIDHNIDQVDEESALDGEIILQEDSTHIHDSLIDTDRLLPFATNSTALTNDSNILVDANSRNASREQSNVPQSIDSLDVWPTFPSNKTKSTNLDIVTPIAREVSVMPLRTNLKPIAQLSPNASFVRILSRQINGDNSGIQSIKSIKRLRLRPITLARQIPTTTTTTTTTTESIVKSDERNKNVSTKLSSPLMLIKKLKSNFRRNQTSRVTQDSNVKSRIKSLPFRNKLQSNEIRSIKHTKLKVEVATTARSLVKENRSQLNRPSTLLNRNSQSIASSGVSLNVRPSFRLTSRLSSNHPAARIQSLFSNRNPSSSSQIHNSRQRFRTPSRPPSTNNSNFPKVGSRILPRFPPKIITHKNLKAKSPFDIFTNIKKEPLTESPNKLRLVTESTINVDIEVATEYIQDFTTEFPDLEDEESMLNGAVKENVSDIQISKQSNLNAKLPFSLRKRTITTDRTVLDELPKVETTTENIRTKAPLLIPPPDITVTESQKHVGVSSTPSANIETTTVKSYSNFSASPRQKKIENKSNNGDKVMTNSEETIKKAKSHPLLASIRSRIPSSVSNINNSYQSNNKTHRKTDLNKSFAKSNLFPKRILPQRHNKAPINPTITNSTITASTFATPSSKPSAGRLGLLFPTPRSDVAVSLRYVIDLFPKHTMLQYRSFIQNTMKMALDVVIIQEAWC